MPGSVVHSVWRLYCEQQSLSRSDTASVYHKFCAGSLSLNPICGWAGLFLNFGDSNHTVKTAIITWLHLLHAWQSIQWGIYTIQGEPPKMPSETQHSSTYLIWHDLHCMVWMMRLQSLHTLTPVADLGLENGEFSVEWERLRGHEFLETTPTSGQNLVCFALNFLFAC